MTIIVKTIGTLILAASGALFLTQCSSSSSNGGTGNPTDDAGADANAGCPATAPTTGTSCSLATGTQCTGYTSTSGDCGSPFVCDNGTWTGQPLSAITEGCPTSVPSDGSDCTSFELCGHSGLTCPFTCDKGGENASAVCTSNKWVVTQSGSQIACEVDSGTDAGDGG